MNKEEIIGRVDNLLFAAGDAVEIAAMAADAGYLTTGEAAVAIGADGIVEGRGRTREAR